MLVSGESGIGKSHLCEAFLDHISQTPHAVLRCQCSALHAHTAFHPIIEAIERAAGISREDTASDRLSKLRKLLDEWPSRDDQAVPLFATLLSLPTTDLYPDFNLTARDIRKRIIDTLVDQLASQSEREPMVLLFEDAQWSDPSTQDLLAAAVERIKTARLLSLITARSEFEPGWVAASPVTGLALNRLDRRHSAEMAKLVAECSIPVRGQARRNPRTRRRRPAVRRGIYQVDDGARRGAGGREPILADRDLRTHGHSGNAARPADVAAGQARDRQAGGPAGSHHRPDISVLAALPIVAVRGGNAGGIARGGGQDRAHHAPASRRRSPLRVQARTHPGCSL